MLSFLRKSSSKEDKKKSSKESIIETIYRKFKITLEDKSCGSARSRSGGNNIVSRRDSRSRVPSISPSPSKLVACCQSFAERPQAHPLPLPRAHNISIGHSHSGTGCLVKPGLEERSKPLHVLPLPKPRIVPGRLNETISEGELATASVSSDSSSDSDDQTDSHALSSLTSDYENGNRAAANSPPSFTLKDQSPIMNEKSSGQTLKLADPSHDIQILSWSPKQAPLSMPVLSLQIPHRGAFCSAPDSSMSSPSRSPIQAFGTEEIINCVAWLGKTNSDVGLLGSGHCSSPGSIHTSGHNSIGGDILGQLLWPNSRCSPECSPMPSPRMTSPGPSSRINSGAVIPLHPRAGMAMMESTASWLDDVKQQSHRLPLPPLTILNTCPFSPAHSMATSPSLPQSPNKAEHRPSPGSQFKKGRLLGRGTFGDVYLGFNSESGEMCAMKEVTLLSDDGKSKESAQQLGQEIVLLSQLRHPNIVRYYGSELVDDKLYIYLEYVSGGSIYKLLQEYGQFGEMAICSYTQQILSGLAYLHAKNTVHRDIKGANILVDPSGCVKLSDFGMAKHITGQPSPLSFKGSPHWMAPEVIKNSNGCNLAVDIWSLGCTVLEMATTEPPWSQFEGVAAIFKIGNSKELPAIPDHLSDDCKDFVKQCLQRNPLCCPTAVQLLDHPFLKNFAPVERQILTAELSEATAAVVNQEKLLGIRPVTNFSSLHSEGITIQSRSMKSGAGLSNVHAMKNASCPVSPVGSPLLHSRCLQNLRVRMSQSPPSCPQTLSGSSTPLRGGGCAIPYHHSQKTFLQENIGMLPRSQNSFYMNSSNSGNEPKPGLFVGMSQASMFSMK